MFQLARPFAESPGWDLLHRDKDKAVTNLYHPEECGCIWNPSKLLKQRESAGVSRVPSTCSTDTCSYHSGSLSHPKETPLLLTHRRDLPSSLTSSAGTDNMDAAVSSACTIHNCCRMERTEDESWLVLQHLSHG